MKIFSLIFAAFLCAFAPASAQTELLASKSTPQYASLKAMQNGLSVITLLWPLNHLEENRIEASYAGLATIVSGSAPNMTAFEADTFRDINGINIGITMMPKHIMLTMTAPNEGFEDALHHLRGLLTQSEFSRDWYKRQQIQQIPLLSTKTRRPENILGVLSDFVLFPEGTDGTDTSDLSFVYGMPSHVVIRTEAQDVKSQIGIVINNLPLQNPIHTYPTPVETDLPKGVIYAPDPDSHETLIYIVKTETFDGPEDQVGANLLVDYMGAYQGSEMFRIIRQELRAAYSPASDFEQIGKNRAFMGLSATVLSEDWPNILSEIQGIYDRARAGDATLQGLNNNQRRLLGHLDYQFATNPRWGATQYMNEYGDGVIGRIDFPLFRAIVQADLQKVLNNAPSHLPPFDDYLVILIGGTTPPPEAMKAKGYCEQPLSKPLRYCLTQLR